MPLKNAINYCEYYILYYYNEIKDHVSRVTDISMITFTDGVIMFERFIQLGKDVKIAINISIAGAFG